MGKMVVNILATFAESEVDLLRMLNREAMAIARATRKLGRMLELPAHRARPGGRGLRPFGPELIPGLMEVRIRHAARPASRRQGS
jgi:hypothetical protein